jgi:hypothetical protein
MKKDGTEFHHAKLDTDDTTNTITANQPKPIENLLHSLFRSVSVYFNGTCVRTVDSNYGLKEFVETSLNYSEESVKNRLAIQFFQPSTLDFSNSKTVELYGRLNILPLDRLILPHVEVSFKFAFQDPDYYIIENTALSGTTSNLKIVSANLYIRNVVPVPEIILAHERILALKKTHAIYEYKKGVIITQNLSSGTSQLDIPNFYLGIRPSLAIFMLCKSSIFAGERKSSPYEFKNLNLSSFQFILNGESRPSQEMKIEIDEKNSCFAQAFSKLHEALGHHGSLKSNMVTPDNYVTDRFMIGEDFTSLTFANSDINQINESAVLGVRGTFNKPLEQLTVAILYLSVQSAIEIDANRSCRVLY